MAVQVTSFQKFLEELVFATIVLNSKHLPKNDPSSVTTLIHEKNQYFSSAFFTLTKNTLYFHRDMLRVYAVGGKINFKLGPVWANMGPADHQNITLLNFSIQLTLN